MVRPPTQPVVEKQDLLSINVCARTAEVLLRMEQVGISDTTVNRNLRGLPDPEVPPIRVLGVDDCPKAKANATERYWLTMKEQVWSMCWKIVRQQPWQNG